MAVLSAVAEYGGGAFFGAALFASGVSNPVVISAQMHLANFHMVKSMVAASAVSAIVIYVANRSKYATISVRNPQNLGFFTFDGNVIGGLLIGVGMALTGACPGTVFAQVGSGLSSGLFTVCGGVLGGLAYILTKPSLERLRDNRKPTTVSATSSSDATFVVSSARLTVQGTFNPSPFTVLLAWEALCMLMLRSITALEPASHAQNSLLNPITGGLVIGLAQAGVIAVTKHAVGVSKAYEDLGCCVLEIEKTGIRGLFTPSILFAAGIVAGSAVVANSFALPTVQSSTNIVARATALFGGALMAFGARVAGGCTSGHGITGMVTFSWASFISVAAMFAGGIASAAVLG